ncbi:putative bifunctional diguanylate cyclase/phosphodiesterase [Oxalobacteraceae bacterium A2-2]
MFLYLTNFFVFVIMGGALLMAAHRHTSQAFARDMGWSTMFASLVAMGYMITVHARPEDKPAGLLLVALGAVPSVLFLISGVVRLAGRRLPRPLAACIALLLLAVMLAPADGTRLFYWALINMAVLCTVGALATHWLWRSKLVEWLVGPLLILLGLNQIVLLTQGADGVPLNLFGAIVLRVAVACVFLFAALDRSIGQLGRLYTRFQLLTEHSLQGVVVTDGQRILYANPAALAIYGLPRNAGIEALAHLPQASFNTDILHMQHSQLHQHAVDVARWEGKRMMADGRERDLRFQAWRIDWEGTPASQLLITDDTERNTAARELQHQATHDELTGLPNRSMLVPLLKQYCVPDGSPCTLVVLNIDRFKLFNQSQGHVAGDHVLQAFAAKLHEVLGPHASLLRLGGDEFGIIEPDALGARDLSWRLHNACLQPLEVPDGEYFIDASMGMAVFPTHARKPEGLLRAANAAMYQAKRTPGTSMVVAEQRFEQMSVQALEHEQALRRSFKSSEVYLDYQPKIDATSGELLGFEALARWQRPGYGSVSPVEFIQIAEHTGLITELGGMLLREACRQIAEWLAAYGDCLPVAVNVSPVQLLNAGFLQMVEDALQRYAVPARYLTLEITESAAVNNLEETRLQLQQLRELGVVVAMDDFGTGFSSLSMLRRLPLSILKIDRGLVEPLPAPDAVAVVTAICQLADALKLRVVAEGVETEEQAAAARAAGCQEFQGFLYAPPLSAAQAGERLRRTVRARGPLTIVRSA